VGKGRNTLRKTSSSEKKVDCAAHLNEEEKKARSKGTSIVFDKKDGSHPNEPLASNSG